MDETNKTNETPAEQAEPKKPYFSPTQLEMYAKCGEQYRRRYIENEIIPPGIAAVAGRGVHGGIATNFRQKIETRVDLPVVDVVDAAVEQFKAELQGAYELTPEEQAQGRDNVIGAATDTVASLAELHAREVAPEYQPVFVEQPVRLELPGPRDLYGIIDLADERKLVVDHKTAAKSKSQADVDNSVQLTVYAAFHKALTGELPAAVRLETLVKSKKQPKRQVLESTRNSADFTALANRINAVSAGVAAGVFQPAPTGAWWCGARWCGYWDTCKFVNTERTLVELRVDT